MTDDIRLTAMARCAGCGAKLGADALQRLLADMPAHADSNLLIGYDKSDDASVYRISDELAIVQTIDFFPPVVDDPYAFGCIAAANALSDIYAMGGSPAYVQNVLIATKSMPEAVIRDILRGGLDKATEAGVSVAGGHSIYGAEPVYGMAVTGFVNPRDMLTNGGAKAGDVLILTKPLGMGIYLTARKAGMLSGEDEREAIAHMERLNRAACEAAKGLGVHACTDITGFGLINHAAEMARASGVTIELTASDVPVLPKALELASMGLLPEGAYRNRDFAKYFADIGDLPLPLSDLLYDPQTSGGLLMAVDKKDAEQLLSRIKKDAPEARIVGRVANKAQYIITIK